MLRAWSYGLAACLCEPCGLEGSWVGHLVGRDAIWHLEVGKNSLRLVGDFEAAGAVRCVGNEGHALLSSPFPFIAPFRFELEQEILRLCIRYDPGCHGCELPKNCWSPSPMVHQFRFTRGPPRQTHSCAPAVAWQSAPLEAQKLTGQVVGCRTRLRIALPGASQAKALSINLCGKVPELMRAAEAALHSRAVELLRLPDHQQVTDDTMRFLTPNTTLLLVTPSQPFMWHPSGTGQQLTVGTFTMEVASLRPRIFVVKEFVDAQERRQLEHHIGVMRPSLVEGGFSPMRNSLSAPVSWTSLVPAVKRRIHFLLSRGLGNHSAYDVQASRYSLGQYYLPHFDTGPELQRLATLLIYLRAPTKGGETNFPLSESLDCGCGLSFQPTPGMALLFYNMAGVPLVADSFAKHAGCPVRAGDKLVLSIWARA